ncbi:MgtC/SapB family protein [Thalassoglobus polymorphus]|uniref:Putative Mg(2+) transport ATPase n=1 Tax=Thalassoglobus polymorphus TaxID=2527994 RepID=A0A517QUY0_9PLAN|nr:MgtC/SapB family protein [Thalassoglobus polymorphus]QDT35442.1 putative Mg(2+) transport ATPase [Thalassoglobus polymorphus]
MQFDPMASEFWIEIGVSVLCGSIVGIERELNRKPIGVRTCVLVCLGTALFVRVGSLVSTENSDPTRIIGQIVSGIGFLGGGVILARGEVVTGVTTASIVWLLAAIGTMVGASQFAAAIVVSVVAVLTLLGIDGLESAITRLREHRRKDKDE